MASQDPNGGSLSNFNRCRFRSPTKEDYGHEACCVKRRKIGYVCYELDINGLEEGQCKFCKKFSPKIDGQKE